MEGVLHTTLLTSTLFLTSIHPQASTSAAISPIPTIGQESFREVQSGDSLKTISDEVYGDDTGVKFILKDNEWIVDPNHIEPGWQIKVRKNPLLLKADTQVEDESKSNSDSITPYPTVSKPQQVPTDSISVSASPIISTPSLTPQPSSISTKPPVYTSGPLSAAQIDYLGHCEAGMDPAKNTGNGFYGAFQFSYGTWKSMGTGFERADLAPLDVQIDAVQRLLSRSSIYTQFPGCSRKMASIGLI